MGCGCGGGAIKRTSAQQRSGRSREDAIRRQRERNIERRALLESQAAAGRPKAPK